MIYCANLKKTKNDVSFDGSIRNAHIGHGVIGEIFQATPLFNDGEVISTSEIVLVGFVPACGWFVETIDGSRYHIASTGTSSAQSGVIDEDMAHKQFHIDVNPEYFKPLQWSN